MNDKPFVESLTSYTLLPRPTHSTAPSICIIRLCKFIGDFFLLFPRVPFAISNHFFAALFHHHQLLTHLSISFDFFCTIFRIYIFIFYVRWPIGGAGRGAPLSAGNSILSGPSRR